MAEYPALMLWTDAYLGDAYHLTTEEHGAYFLLLMAAWRTPDCRLPDDDKLLAKITKLRLERWRQRFRPALLKFWMIQDGHWVQKRLLKEREKASVTSQNRARSANEMWRRKRLKSNVPEDAKADANGMHRARATPQPHPKTQEYDTSSELPGFRREPDTHIPQAGACGGHNPPAANGNNGRRYRAGFEEFWECWNLPGTKVARKDAKARYDRLVKGGEVSHEQLCSGVRRYMIWARAHPDRYVKNPSTWLNKGCWTDDLTERKLRPEDDESHWGLYS